MTSAIGKTGKLNCQLLIIRCTSSAGSSGEGQLYYGSFNVDGAREYKSGIKFTGNGIDVVNTSLNSASGNINCNELNAKSGKIDGVKVATINDLSTLEKNLQDLISTAYYNGYADGVRDGSNTN